MIKQEIFNKVVRHLHEQGERALDKSGKVCVYRDGIGKNGKVLTCAVGCLIPEGLYDPACEGASTGSALSAKSSASRPKEAALRKSLKAVGVHITEPIRSLLSALQGFHDRSWSTRAYNKADLTLLQQIAIDHHLSLPPEFRST